MSSSESNTSFDETSAATESYHSVKPIEDRFICRKSKRLSDRTINMSTQTYNDVLTENVKQAKSELNIRQFTIRKSHSPAELDSKKRSLLSLRHEDIQPFRKYTVEGWKDNYYTSLLDWSGDFICTGFGAELNLYNLANDEDNQSSVSRCCFVDFNSTVLTSLKCCPIGPKVALGYMNGSLKIYDYVKEKTLYQGYHHLLRIAAIDWSGDLILTGSKDQFLKIFDPRQRKCLNLSSKFEHMHSQEICGVKQNGNLICSGGNDNRVFIYDTRSEKVIGDYSHGAAVKAISWINRKTVVTGGGTADKKLKFWSSSQGVYKQIDTGSQVCSLSWSVSTSQLVSCQGFSLNQIILWSKEGERVFTFHGHSTRVLYSALSPNGEYLASGAGDQSLFVWKLFYPKAKQSVLESFRGMR